MSAGAVVAVVLYAVLLAGMLAYGLNCFFMVWWHRRIARTRLAPSAPPDAIPDAEPHPLVTVQLPLYNEERVAPRLLDALAAAGFRATFFVVGERARRHPDLVRRIHAAGHEVANHTDTHAEPRSIGWRAFRQELLRTSALLEDLLGEPVRLMRPPKGALTPAKLLAAWSLGLSVVLWNRDPKDYRITDIADIERWLAGYRPHSGDIVLMHDTHPWAAHAVEHWRQATALTSVPVGEWIGRRRPPRGERHSGTPHAAATPPSALPSREQSPSTN